MIGLEYILNLYVMQHVDLADRLGIKKQNINMWIKGKQNIPKKYLPILEEIFSIKGEFFSKELNDIEKLQIQKEKLKAEMKPIIYHKKEVLDENVDKLKQIPVYDISEIDTIEMEIEKARIRKSFNDSLEVVNIQTFIDSYKIVTALLQHAGTEAILHKSLQGLAHYLNVLPGDITSGEEQLEFESELFEVLDDYNY